MQIDGHVAGWPTAVIGVVIVVLTGYALLHEITRSWRTVLAGFAALTAAVAALWLTPAAYNITRAVVIVLLGYGTLMADRRLWAIPRRDGEFAYGFSAAVHKLSSLRKQAGSISHRMYLAQFAAIEEEIRSLPAPSDDWRQIRDAYADEHSSRLERMSADQPDPVLPE